MGVLGQEPKKLHARVTGSANDSNFDHSDPIIEQNPAKNMTAPAKQKPPGELPEGFVVWGIVSFPSFVSE
jgi:hypothetical protein